MEKRVILLVGKTGNGKSTMANVLTNTENFPVFNGSQSGTREYMVGKFQHEEIEYTIIDTPGINDTRSGNEINVYKEIVDAVYSFRDGLNQVFFVTRGRLTAEEISSYTLLSEAFFDEEKIPEFMTIVRTNFGDFGNEEACKNDIDEMESQGGEISDLIKIRRNNVIHVDNHPRHQKDRDKSRTILLNYLKECKEIYQHVTPYSVGKRVQEIEEAENEIFEILSLKGKINNALEIGEKIKIAGEMMKKEGNTGSEDKQIIAVIGFYVEVLGFVIESVGKLILHFSLNSKCKKTVERVGKFLNESRSLLEELKNCEGDNKRLDDLFEECIDVLVKERKSLVIRLAIERMYQEKENHYE
ncbi:823_t:CDS:1 [Acaulospora morrowiae]|uniref:823_t:CDS:1 n=1 Tax=Acaulospora morrowiae TaxID=94023 RepID=A0A9N9B625_9GLOM|nr:823_t:CDS:1 [Acaulospora morrowiae]